MTIAVEIISVVVVIVLVIYREKAAQNIVRFQSKHFGNKVDVDDVRAVLMWFALISLLVSIDQACRHFKK